MATATAPEAVETALAVERQATRRDTTPTLGPVEDAGVRLLVAEDGRGGLSQWATSRLQPGVAYRLTVDAAGRAACSCPMFHRLGRCIHSVAANGEV